MSIAFALEFLGFSNSRAFVLCLVIPSTILYIAGGWTWNATFVVVGRFTYLPNTVPQRAVPIAYACAASLWGRAVWTPANLRDESRGRRAAGTPAACLCEGDWNIR
jgi:hypothetical protein